MKIRLEPKVVAEEFCYSSDCDKIVDLLGPNEGCLKVQVGQSKLWATRGDKVCRIVLDPETADNVTFFGFI